MVGDRQDDGTLIAAAAAGARRLVNASSSHGS
jgi:hypothetical protein